MVLEDHNMDEALNDNNTDSDIVTVME